VISGGGYGTRLDGTWQEYLVAPANLLMPIPENVSDLDVAAMTAGAGYLTAYLALRELAGFTPGQRVLAPGIGGAVGMATVQIAQALGASQAISTASTTAKVEQAQTMGYDQVIDLSRESLREGVARLTNGAGVHIVIDGVGGPLTGHMLASLAPGGTLVSVGYSGGTETTINVTDLIWRTAHMVGYMFSLFSQETLQAANQAIFDLLAAGRIKPVVARTFPLEEAADAQRYLIEGRPFGRVLLTL
jgi:NADPH:quinone reductase-like Zn-dependent oxidoreductase